MTIQETNWFERNCKVNTKSSKQGEKAKKSKGLGSNGEQADIRCQQCDECSDYLCPNHSYLYSTDEASSSEADFVGHSYPKTKNSMPKRKIKEVKKTQYGMLNFAKLFTQ
jgi:hypothetical protein